MFSFEMHVHPRPEHERRQPTVAAESSAKSVVPSSVTTFAEVLRQFAVQDWYMLGYLVIILLAVLNGSGPERATCIRYATLDVVGIFVALLLVRGRILRGFVGALLYRLTIFGAVLGSFFQLKTILPEVSSRLLDAHLFSFDMTVFHYEPALAWDRFVTPATTEWFAFFYYGYFFLIGIHALPFAFLAKKNKVALAEFGLGIVTIFCTAHIIYMLVPGYGPYSYLADQFQHKLEGGLWWRLVNETVQAAGSQKDIFPSLHTCAPTFLALFSFRNRKSLPFKYTWPFVALFASQMVLATMFLRWHYLVDICAGLTLAVTATFVGARVVRWERERRERLGRDPVWTDLY
jgi:hypothetical protein